MADATDPYTQEVQERIDALPEDIRKFIYSADMEAIVQQIGRKNQLHIDQMEALEAEVVAAMIGITQREEFVENLMDGVNLDKPKAEAVAKDVNDMIFITIRESMKGSAAEQKPDLPTVTHADVALAEKTVSLPKPPPPPLPPSSSPPAPAAVPKPTDASPQPPKPKPYAVDPYREPPE